ncbi:PoNe immunity protein domain-containing protein [Ichthyenterobacterium magnum]|uniref:Uncharacterized protein DUF1910 n=1 Tax=Ichthyenterobacterium magnum TaxID=1230530 RepID=A0A420DXR2_9FLAO|nr:PoNe immunity protein domain-containing protein [Ichthyenterobacterium magnum]RKE99040.1 uncharacterized protein DUF1910 [Ichthyenterobacterium magnum]
MRDTNKSEEYFKQKITDQYQRNNSRLEKINNNQIKKERVSHVLHNLSLKYLSIVKWKYLAGYDMFSKDVISDLERVYTIKQNVRKEIDLNTLKWKENGTFKKTKQYLKPSFYQFLDILSLGFLLDLSESYFLKLVNVIDEDGVKDYLLELIIKAKISNRKILTKDTFSKGEHPLQKLIDIVKMENKEEAQRYLKHFLEKYWYKSLKGLKGHNDHNKENGNYEGYWCFVAAAIVKIKQLDDSSFRDNKYYPKDLV